MVTHIEQSYIMVHWNNWNNSKIIELIESIYQISLIGIICSEIIGIIVHVARLE